MLITITDVAKEQIWLFNGAPVIHYLEPHIGWCVNFGLRGDFKSCPKDAFMTIDGIEFLIGQPHRIDELDGAILDYTDEGHRGFFFRFN